MGTLDSTRTVSPIKLFTHRRVGLLRLNNSAIPQKRSIQNRSQQDESSLIGTKCRFDTTSSKPANTARHNFSNSLRDDEPRDAEPGKLRTPGHFNSDAAKPIRDQPNCMSDTSDFFAPPVSPLHSLSYWQEARRPLVALLFLLPLLAWYEIGVMSLGAETPAARNGADCWMRSWLMYMGLAHHWVLPVLVVGALLSWHLSRSDRWRCSLETLGGMFAESLLFAVLLILLGQILSISFRSYGLETASIPALATGGVGQRAVSFIGAGIYEEVLFRLAAIPVGFYLFRAMLIPRAPSAILSVCVTSTLFALAHYLGSDTGFAPSTIVDAAWSVADDPAAWYGFTFRLTAGLCFSALFLLRGFGITVGAHAIYDIFVGVLMQ